MQRRSRTIAAIALLAFAGSFTGGRARAQTDGPGLGAFQLDAHAAAVHFTYASPGLLATGDVIFAASIPESAAKLSGGPFGHALSSIAWPGPLLSDLGVLVEQGTSEDQRPPFRLPSYPVRAEAFNPQGPAEQTASPVPGARMHAQSEGFASQADGRLNGLAVPGVLEVGAVTSDARSYVEDGVGVSEAVSSLSDVSVLAGLLTFDSITTTITATSDGTEAVPAATTRVAGFKFAGVDAVVDRDGIRLADEPAGGTDATQVFTDDMPFDEIVAGLRNLTDPASAGLRELLVNVDGGLDELARQSGIRVRLLDTATDADGAEASANAGGLLIELFYDGMTTPLFSDLLALLPYELLPAEYPEQMSAVPFTPQALALLLRETHINTLTLGAASADVRATPPFDFDFSFDVDFGTGDLGSGFSGGSVVPPSFSTPGVLSSSDAPTVSGSPSPVAAPSGTPRITPQALPIAASEAVPGAIAVGIVAAAPLFGRWSRRLARHTLEPRA